MAMIADARPKSFLIVLVSLKIIKPMRAENKTTLTFVTASTVESFHPVVE